MNDLPEMRISDRDRMVAILRLQDAYAEGRITHFELDQRLDQVNSARIRADLDLTVADLPAVAVPDQAAIDAELDRSVRLRQGWIAWVGVAVLVNVIWLAIWTTTDAGRPGYWPIWVMGPWGAVMLMSTLKHKNRS